MSRAYAKRFGRIVLFIIYFWFGVLKLFGKSAADPLVSALLAKTLPSIPVPQFLIFLGLFEMLIGILFLFPRFYKAAVSLFTLHMVAVFLPLILLPSMTWQNFLVPTLDGQYIMKNLALIAVVALIK